MDRTTCTLPAGYADGTGSLHREAELVPLTGREEELLAHCGEEPAAALVTAVLARCLARLGTIAPVSEEVARGLLTADRQFLLLELRAATFGERVEATLSCPWPGCGEKVDVDFSLRSIPVTESADKGPAYRLELPPEAAYRDPQGAEHREIVFRLPNGDDQERIAPLAATNEARALRRPLDRRAPAAGPPTDPRPEAIGRLSPAARAAIERRMEEVAPQVPLTMDVRCPECGRSFEMPFDLQDFFFGELRASRDLLYREVHYLAYHYHWSESEILGLTRNKRRDYIEILADEIERLNHAVA